ncbi:MAG: RNA polymerase sigma factor [Flammeovirgaceae bacterium]
MTTFPAVKLSDEQLLNAFNSGETRALDELYKRHYPKVLQHCLSFTKDTDEAYDLAQEVLLKALSKLGNFNEQARFSTWLYAIAHNYCVDWFRKSRNQYFQRLDDSFDLVDEVDEEEDLLETEKNSQKVLLLLSSLPEQDKQLLILKYEKGYSIKQLQELFGLSSSAVKMRLKRAKLKISQMRQKAA